MGFLDKNGQKCWKLKLFLIKMLEAGIIFIKNVGSWNYFYLRCWKLELFLIKMLEAGIIFIKDVGSWNYFY